jgi:segregation and condensation protein B
MDYFGINSAADLPKIKEVLAEQIVEGTIIRPEDFTDNQIANAMAELPTDEELIEGDVSDLKVNEEGELIITELNESSDDTNENADDESNNLSNDVEDENNPQ